MRLRAIGLAAILSATAAAQPAANPAPELRNRTPGPTVNCVRLESHEALRPSDSDGAKLLYGSGRTIYLTQLGGGCRFRRDDTLVIEPIGSQLCRGDIVKSFDRLSRIPGPSCVLGDFTPFNRPPR